jgi:hypothetical protein
MVIIYMTYGSLIQIMNKGHNIITQILFGKFYVEANTSTNYPGNEEK